MKNYLCLTRLLSSPRTACVLLIMGAQIAGVRSGQAEGAETMPTRWTAQWVAAPDGPARDASVVYFRKTVTMGQVPEHVVVDVSADTRFELHVNGRRVGAGPALADVHHWRYEVFDLAPYLHAGANEIAAVVWNFGVQAAVAQMSARTAFLLRAENARDAGMETGAKTGWSVAHEEGRAPESVHALGYFAASPPELMDGRKMNWSWDGPTEGDARQWLPVKALGAASLREVRDAPTPWMLVRDELPPMTYSEVPAGRVVRSAGFEGRGPETMEGAVTVPARSHVTLLLDRGVLTTAFPTLKTSGGKDSTILLTYSEALYDASGHKGNRNEIEGRTIAGLEDTIVSDGGERRSYRPLWWRTWRYLQIEVTTADSPLTLNSLQAFYTAYPFSAAGKFSSDDPELQRIWETGWRTAQMCAHETYMDTPYWEQLQYVGDTRIQALISYGVSGDDRLARQAIEAYRDSVLPEGLTESRYPSSLTQIIPPFSLLWVGMLRDFWEYRGDAGFVRSVLPSTRGVLQWFSERQRLDGLLGRIAWWPFVDWSPPLFVGGDPPQEADGGSAALTLQFVEALRDGAALEEQMGDRTLAAEYRERADRASAALMRLCWDERAGLLADTPAKKSYSQQANALAVWIDVIPGPRQRDVMTKVLAAGEGGAAVGGETTMSLASYYFRFYVAKAMAHAGLGGEYVPQLAPWRRMLAMGLSTWAENPEPTRSDSHAWSAHPTFDLMTIVAGIAPGAPGFSKVDLEPHLGALKHVAASMPTPHGLVSVQYDRNGEAWAVMVELPEGVSGSLRWGGRSLPLHAGSQRMRLESVPR